MTFKKETKIEINMTLLMYQSVCALDYIERENKRKDNKRYIPRYDSLESLVKDSLESLYDIELFDYDNTKEALSIIAKSLLLWCVSKGHFEEYKRLERLY